MFIQRFTTDYVRWEVVLKYERTNSDLQNITQKTKD
jgi:hypothetical protein